MDFNQAMQGWLATRPESIQRLAAEFPPGTVLNVLGKRMHILGYNESDMLIISLIDPMVDYDSAMEQKQYVCAAHLR